MNVDHYKKLLLAKERELTPEVGRLQEESRGPETPDVGDSVDSANMELQLTGFSEEAAVLSDTLTQVKDALRRIEDGTYGKCVTCGREISAARLEAVPWTPYCIEHQQEHDDQARDTMTVSP